MLHTMIYKVSATSNMFISELSFKKLASTKTKKWQNKIFKKEITQMPVWRFCNGRLPFCLEISISTINDWRAIQIELKLRYPVSPDYTVLPYFPDMSNNHVFCAFIK